MVGYKKNSLHERIAELNEKLVLATSSEDKQKIEEDIKYFESKLETAAD